jgi:hypothetical protein
MYQFRLTTFKHEFIKISVSSHTAFAVETHLADGQWLAEQVNMANYAIPSRNPKVDCFEDTGTLFSATKIIY